jgi:hypothetical protein
MRKNTVDGDDRESAQVGMTQQLGDATRIRLATFFSIAA